MALDSSSLPAADPAPIAGTPDPAETGDTGGTTPTPPQPVDWEARYTALLPDYTRKAQRLAALEAAAGEDPDPDPEADGDDEPAPVRRTRSQPTQRELDAIARAEAAEVRVAESIYGTDVVEAFNEWLPMWNGTATRSDEITALLAFADKVRSVVPQASAPAPAALQSREAATAPRVMDNRSDAPAPDLDLDPSQFEDGKNGGARGFFLKQLEKITG